MGQKSTGLYIKSEKEAKNIIFDGNKTDTLNVLKKVILKKTLWCEYMEQVLDLITINSMDFHAGIIPISNLRFYFSQRKTSFVFYIICKTNVYLSWSDKVFCIETGPTQQRV